MSNEDDEDAFERDYHLRVGRDGSNTWAFPPQGVDEHQVWTIIEGDSGDLYVSAGWHWVNRVDYVLTEETWTTGDELYLWHHYEDEGEEL